MAPNDAVRFVLAGSCGAHSGKVVQWSYTALLTACDGAPPNRARLEAATMGDVERGLRAQWPSEIDVNFAATSLTMLFHGRRLGADTKVQAEFPNLVAAAVAALARAPHPATDELLPIHLVFRAAPGPAPAGSAPAARQEQKPAQRKADAGCCVVS